MKRSGPSETSWEKHKNSIKQYYIADDLPLREVAKLMKSNYQFDAPLHMYKSRFKKWDFQKYNRDVVIQAIVRKLTERDHQGKSTIIYLHGKEITRAEVMRYLSRKGIRDLGDAFQPGGLVATNTPLGLSIVTPPPIFHGDSSQAFEFQDDVSDETWLNCDLTWLRIPGEIDQFLHSDAHLDQQTLNLDLLQSMFPILTEDDCIVPPDKSMISNRPHTPIQAYNPKKQGTPWSNGLFDQLSRQPTSEMSLLAVESYGNRSDATATCGVFGNSPMHDAILHTSTPVEYDSSRALVQAIQSLISRGANAEQPNHAGLTPAQLAYSLGLGYEFEIALHGGTELPAVKRPMPFCSSRVKRWLEDYYHHARLGCRPAACGSDLCKWWDYDYKSEQLAKANLLFGIPKRPLFFAPSNDHRLVTSDTSSEFVYTNSQRVDDGL